MVRHLCPPTRVWPRQRSGVRHGTGKVPQPGHRHRPLAAPPASAGTARPAPAAPPPGNGATRLAGARRRPSGGYTDGPARPPSPATPVGRRDPRAPAPRSAAKPAGETRYPVVREGDLAAGTVRTEKGRLGPVLTDPDGHTLYISTRDPQGASSCTDGCTRLWRPFLVAGTEPPTPPFGAVARPDGTSQWSHAGQTALSLERRFRRRGCHRRRGRRHLVCRTHRHA